MQIEEQLVKDLTVGQKFIDENGIICTVTSLDFEPDSDGCGDCEACDEAEFCWVYFDRPDRTADSFRLWIWSDLNIVSSN